jgi:hypothetical protein
MAGHNSDTGNNLPRNAKARRRRVVAVGATAGAFVAAATAGSMVTASPAKADILDNILDPILQPIVTSLTDALSGIDPAAATDLTSLFDMSGLSLNSVDPAAALAAAADPASALAAADTTTTTGNVDIPLIVQEGTEPTVQATVDGSDTTLLVDTGSSGLVIPYQDLGLKDLLDLGFPTGLGISGYSGGVDYLYLTYDTTVDYEGTLTTTDTPVYVEIFSWPTSSSSPLDFQDFLSDNDVSGILGIGITGTGPGTNPLEAAGYSGVLVDVPQNELVLGSNPYTATATLTGAPRADLEVSINGGTPVAVSGDIDSGGVNGTIPSFVTSTVPVGSSITVYDTSDQELYSYLTTATNDPTVTSSTTMDTGYEPFSLDPIYLDYSTDTTSFDDVPTM